MSNILNLSDFYKNFPYTHAMYNPHMMEFDIFSPIDNRLKFAKNDFEIVGNISYLELLHRIELNEVKLEDLNSRM